MDYQTLQAGTANACFYLFLKSYFQFQNYSRLRSFFIHPGFGFAAMSYPRLQNEAAPMVNGYTWDI
jgi:hypothetical protein